MSQNALKSARSSLSFSFLPQIEETSNEDLLWHEPKNMAQKISSGSNRGKKQPDRPFLLLDIRDQEDYKKFHIAMSKSWPATKLSRAMNYESKEMLRFKNVEGKLIIVVDYDESVAPEFATTLIQRGYDNVFVLSGGVRVAKIKFPEELGK